MPVLPFSPPQRVSEALQRWLVVLNHQYERDERLLELGLVHPEDAADKEAEFEALGWALAYGRTLAISDQYDLEHLFADPDALCALWGTRIRAQFPDADRVSFIDYLEYNDLEFYEFLAIPSDERSAYPLPRLRERRRLVTGGEHE